MSTVAATSRSVSVSASATCRRLVPVLLATAVALAALLLPAASAEASPRTIDPVELQQVHMINAFRRAHRLPALRLDRHLTTAATWMANDLAWSGTFSHYDTHGRDPFQRLRAFGYPSTTTWRGENIAAGFGDAPSTYSQWLNSPPHRANWLTSQYRAIGIARVYVPGSPYGWYWVTDFGSRYTSHPL